MNLDELKPNQLWIEEDYYAPHEDIYIYTVAQVKYQDELKDIPFFHHTWWVILLDQLHRGMIKVRLNENTQWVLAVA